MRLAVWKASRKKTREDSSESSSTADGSANARALAAAVAPMACPSSRVVSNIPDATPRCSRGSEFITVALLMGIEHVGADGDGQHEQRQRPERDVDGGQSQHKEPSGDDRHGPGPEEVRLVPIVDPSGHHRHEQPQGLAGQQDDGHVQRRLAEPLLDEDWHEGHGREHREVVYDVGAQGEGEGLLAEVSHGHDGIADLELHHYEAGEHHQKEQVHREMVAEPVGGDVRLLSAVEVTAGEDQDNGGSRQYYAAQPVN